MSNALDELEHLRAENAALRAELEALRQPAAKGEHQQLVRDWCAYYARRNPGDKYPFAPRDAQAAKRLLKHFGDLATVKRFIKSCHKRAAEGYPFGNCETLYDIANGIARLQAALATPAKVAGRNGHRHEAPRPHVTLV